MNWLDFVLIGILVVGAVVGIRIGLIRAALTVVGVYVGWLLAGQWSDDVGALFADALDNDTLVTVISYAIIIIGALIVSSIAAKVIKPLLTVFTLGLSGLVDKLVGLALGLLIGVAISGALIIALARLTYNFDIGTLEQAVPGQVASQLDQIPQEQVREALETALTESQLVSIFIDVSDALPADALGYVPSDFKVALEILEKAIE